MVCARSCSCSLAQDVALRQAHQAQHHVCELEMLARESHHNWRLAEAWFLRKERWARMDVAGLEVSACTLAVHKARCGACSLLQLLPWSSWA